MSDEKPEVRLYKQNYEEASINDPEQIGALELLGMVSFADEAFAQTIGPVLKMVNEGIRKEAAELGATHVFGIEYKIHSSGAVDNENGLDVGRRYILASGDAYHPRQTS